MEAVSESNSVAGSQALRHACSTLRPEHLAAIPLLIEGRTQREVAKLVGVCEETLSRWRTGNDAFIEEYLRQRALIYDSGLQRAYSRIDAQLDHVDPKIVQGAAKVRLENDAQLRRANSTVTHTVILDKLQAALTGKDASAIDAEYEELAQGGVPSLTTDSTT